MFYSLLSKSFVFILIFSIHIYGLNENETNSSNKFFQTKNITCDLHNFIRSINNKTDEDYQIFVNDTIKYCSNFESTESNRLLCQMIFLELQIGCLLINRTHLIPIRYNVQSTSKQICSLAKVTLISGWIGKKLSDTDKELAGSSLSHLCSIMTLNNETLRLARFFYRIGWKIRQADLYTSRIHTNRSLVIATNLEKPIIKNQTNEEELHQEKIMQDDLRNHQILNNPPDELNVNKSKSINQDKQLMIEGGNVEEKKEKIPMRKRITNETKQSEDGVPLGRAGEQPEHEQVNERPKPKPLDANVVFKQNPQDERNWIQGKNVENRVEDSLNMNLNHMPKAKFNENPIIVPQQVRRRGSFRLRLSRHSTDDAEGDGLSNSFVTSILVLILCIVLIYLILHNKNKVLGLIIEGCKRRRTSNRHVRLSQSIH